MRNESRLGAFKIGMVMIMIVIMFMIMALLMIMTMSFTRSLTNLEGMDGCREELVLDGWMVEWVVDG